MFSQTHHRRVTTKNVQQSAELVVARCARERMGATSGRNVHSQNVALDGRPIKPESARR